MQYVAVLSWLAVYLVLGVAVGRPFVALHRRLSDDEATGLALSAVAVTAIGYWLGLTLLAWPAFVAGVGVLALSVGAAAWTDTRDDWQAHLQPALVGLAAVALIAGLTGVWPDERVARYFLRLETGYVVRWYVAFLGLGALALPVSALVFDRFADRGAGVALPFALGTLGVVGYWVGHLSFGPVALAAGLVVLGAGSAIALWRGVAVEWRAYAEVVVVFSLAFGLLVALRGVNPSIWPGGGEKFLDFGLLKSLLRADALPPEDMWFAGEPVKYYYGGHMLAALLTELTATPARYAYNLALASVYGTLAATVYGLARAVAAERGRSPRTAGAFAVVFVAVASNLSTPLRLLIWKLPDWAGDRLAAAASLEVAQRPSVAAGPDSFNYWVASRIVDRRVVDGDQWHYINEFPFFAFRNGDLHAHMVSTPFLFLVAALLFQYWLTPAADRRRRRALVFLAVPPLGGLLAVVNTWSFPVVGGLTWIALTFAPTDPATLLPRRAERAVGRFREGSPLRTEGVRVGTAVAAAAAVTALAVLFSLPFFTGTASGRSLGFLPESRSNAAGLLVVHGAFLAISVTYLLARDGIEDRLPTLFAVTVVVLLLVTAPYEATAVALFGPVLLVAWILLRTESDVGFETALLVGALGLVMLVEFVYVVEEAGPGRMNTVFKVYMQVWVLWGTAAGVMLADRAPLAATVRALWNRAANAAAGVGRAVGGSTATSSDGGRRTVEVTAGAVTASLIAVLLLASLSLYGGFVVANQFERGTENPTLNGTAYVEDRHGKEAAAIAWLDEREGQPHIVSAPGTSIYQWANPASSLTGLPTVAGWSHEVGYRGEAAYRQRVEDVETIYTGSAAERAALLREYDVTYIYMGPEERQRYGTQDLHEDPGITVATKYPFVVIFRVTQSELQGST
jgi:YYY domain-containing protein